MNSNFNSSYIASNSLTYIPFLAHLAFRPCELLSSLFVRRPPVHISHVNLLLRNHWANCNQTFVEWSLVAPFQICVRWSRLPTKKSVKLKIEKKGDDIKKKSSPLKLLRQSQPNFAEMILGWSPSKSVSETICTILTKFWWNSHWLVPFQKYVRPCSPSTKMAPTAELSLT